MIIQTLNISINASRVVVPSKRSFLSFRFKNPKLNIHIYVGFLDSQGQIGRIYSTGEEGPTITLTPKASRICPLWMVDRKVGPAA